MSKADTLDELRDDFQRMDMPPSAAGTPNEAPRGAVCLCVCVETHGLAMPKGRVSECLLAEGERPRIEK